MLVTICAVVPFSQINYTSEAGCLGTVILMHAECDYFFLYHLLNLLINLESLTQASNPQIN